MNNLFLLFYSPKPQSQVTVLIWCGFFLAHSQLVLSSAFNKEHMTTVYSYGVQFGFGLLSANRDRVQCPIV